MARDLSVNIFAPSDKFEAGVKRMEASARQLHASELRLIAAEERLEKLRSTGKATAGQLANAQAGVISAQDKVAKAHGNTAIAVGKATAATEKAGKQQSKLFSGIGTAAGAMGGAVGLGAAAAGVAMVAFARDTVSAASDLQEQMSATKTLFKDAADEVLAFADSASSIGISKVVALEASNAFGDLFTKIGYTSTASATFSEDLVRMAADFASFKDMDPGETLDKLRSGLAGESEPLRSLGVFLTEAKVKAEGMRLGLADARGELDEGGKVAARYSLIISEMGEAYGDAERTAGSYANTQRRFSAEMDNLKATVGSGLLPILTDLTTIMANVAGSLVDAEKAADSDGDWKTNVEGWLDHLDVWEKIPGALDAMAGGSEKAGDSSKYLDDSMESLSDTQARTKQNVEDSTAALEEQAEALDKVLQATQAQFDSEIAYQQAVLSLSGELADYNEALAANRDAKADNNVSADELRKKELGLADQLLSTGQAAVRQAEDQAAAAGRTLTESEKYDIFRQALIDLKAQFPQLAGQIDGYVARLKAVPAKVETTVRILGASDAELALANVEKRIRGVTNIGGVTVRIPPIKDPVGDGPGRGGAALARVRAALPAGLSITSTYRSPARNAAVGGSPTSYHMDRGNPAVDIAGPTSLLDSFHATLRRMGGWRELIWRAPGHYDHIHAAATGGGVHGPGTGTSDSIPALLSNGEHVWTAREVDKAGGHGAVEALRQQVLRLATGGPVVRATPRPSSLYGRTLTQVTSGLTNPDAIRAAAQAWEDYNRRLERNRALLADAQAAQYELKVAKGAEARAAAQRKVADATKAIKAQQAEESVDRERKAVDKLVESLEKQAQAEEDARRAREEALGRLNDLLDQERDLRARGVEAERDHADKVADIGRRRAAAESTLAAGSLQAATELATRQQDLLDQRREQLEGWARLDERASVHWGNSVEQLLANARDQAAQFEQWSASLAEARARGVSEQVIAALGLDEGPQALGQLRQFGLATAAEIDALNAEVARRTALAGEQTSREQQSQFGDLGRGLVAAQRQYVEALAELQERFLDDQRALDEELVDAQAELLVRQAELATELAAIGQEQGRSYGDAIAQGMRSTIPAIVAAAQELMAAQQGLTAAQAIRSAPASMQNGRYIDNATGRAAYYGPNGEPGYAAGQAPPGALAHRMPDGRTAYYLPGARQPGGILNPYIRDQGGPLLPGYTFNGTGRPEVVVPAQQAAGTTLVVNINAPVFGVDQLRQVVRSGTEEVLAEKRDASLGHGVRR